MAGIALEYRNYVLYICHCSQLVSLESLYFCRHCKRLRCMDCVTVQIDGTCISCPFCNDSIPQADAKAKKYRCGHCYQCPRCATPLATRFVQVSSAPARQESSPVTGSDRKEKEASPKRGSAPSPQVTIKTPPKSEKGLRSSLSSSSFKSPGGTKMYYLTCTHCHWTTREVNIPDKRSLLDFKDQLHPFADRYKKLLSYYKDLDMYERASQHHMRKQLAAGRKVRPFSSLLDTSKIKREKEHHSSPLKEVQSVYHPAVDPEPLSNSFYEDPVDVTTIPSLEQRALHPGNQPKTTGDFWPRPLPLISRKTVRCKGCDHILLKPDVNVNLVRFKIQHVAIQVVPRVRLLHMPKLTQGEPSLVPLSITSPVNYVMKISFEPFGDTKKMKEILSPSVLPEGIFQLKSTDDVNELLDESISSTSSVSTESDYVLSSEPGRLVLKFAVIPTSVEIDAKIAFVVRFSYEPLIEADKDPGSHELCVPVVVNCGHSFA